MTVPFVSIVPWCNWNEWLHVYHDLYSPHHANQTRALTRCQTWHARAPLPLAVECTASLISALQNTVVGDESDAGRLLMSMAVVRFVNSMVDPLQQASFAISITKLAATLNLPRWLVDVRHAATHGTLPSGAVLSTACSTALMWLDENYWRVQQERIGQTRIVLVNWLHRHAAADSAEERLLIVDKLMRAANAAQLRAYVVPALVYERFLVPHDADDRKTAYRAVPDALVDCWAPLLREMHDVSMLLTTNMIEMMVNCIARFEKTMGVGAISLMACWISFVVQNFKFDVAHLEQAEERNGQDLLLANVIRVCLRKKGVWLIAVLRAVLSFVPIELTSRKRDQLLQTTALLEQANEHSVSFRSQTVAGAAANEIVERVTTRTITKVLLTGKTESSTFAKLLGKKKTTALSAEKPKAKKKVRELTLDEMEAKLRARKKLKKVKEKQKEAKETAQAAKEWDLLPPNSMPLGLLPNGNFPNLLIK